MSEPEWLGPASDLLREHSLDEAADCLLAMPARLALLERAVDFLEQVTRLDGRRMYQHEAGDLRRLRRDIIAEHRRYDREGFAASTEADGVAALFQAGYYWGAHPDSEAFANIRRLVPDAVEAEVEVEPGSINPPAVLVRRRDGTTVRLDIADVLYP